MLSSKCGAIHWGWIFMLIIILTCWCFICLAWISDTCLCYYNKQLPDATSQEIKKAYYNCMKACHPDLAGNEPEVTDFCMFINEVYTVQKCISNKNIYFDFDWHLYFDFGIHTDTHVQRNINITLNFWEAWLIFLFLFFFTCYFCVDT